EELHLLREPSDATLHRLNEDELHIGTRDCEHEAGEAGATADITDATRPKQGSHQGRVDDMARPQPGELERTDEAEFLATDGEVFGERPRDVDPRAEQCGCSSRLLLKGLSHGDVSRETMRA